MPYCIYCWVFSELQNRSACSNTNEHTIVMDADQFNKSSIPSITISGNNATYKNVHKYESYVIKLHKVVY
ncbi:hypothetical protein chiPu_0001821 [Chiloscyllium punctatum]|uniref:Uncharacterized protein n=1 Tax=Chiloscyllium punctatum TaxID=137246 RepID=A0A401RZ49_CHIPU|nr:hypothetical protein [Chiloscyllium punctatum]